MSEILKENRTLYNTLQLDTPNTELNTLSQVMIIRQGAVPIVPTMKY